MASFEESQRKGSYYVRFRFKGREFKKSLRLGTPKEAQRLCGAIETTITSIERGIIVMPPEADVAAFLISGGKVAGPVRTPEAAVTLGSMIDEYEATLTKGSKEQNTRKTEAIHGRHLRRILGASTPATSISTATVQRYVDSRAAAGISARTIKKELDTLRFVTKWSHDRGLVPAGPAWVMKAVTLPKEEEKPPFQTWDQIRRQVASGRLDADAQAELWDCLWLTTDQTKELVSWARDHAKHPWLGAMIAFAAYTGARRSEMLRSEVGDWDFESGVVAIRQKKSDKSKTFTRRFVPIQADLAAIMRSYLENHPGCPLLIVNHKGEPLSISQSAHGFRVAVAGTKWDVLRGYHVLRHSIASNLAGQGVDQRIIDELLGHSTAEMSRRYRHLAPDAKRSPLDALFTK